MSTTPPGTPPPNAPPPSGGAPPPGYDAHAQRRYYKDQARAQRNAWRAQRMHWRWQMRGMRRASVLGPLLLIGAGIVFLLIQTGRIDRHAFLESYAHWWPLLLVGAGLVVLAEWLLDQSHMSDPDRPQYRRSIGGGVIVLLLFFVFLGALADTGYSFSRTDNHWILRGLSFDDGSWAPLFGDKHEFDQAIDLPLPAGGSITIVNPRGNVTVTGASDDGRIHVSEHKVVYADSDTQAEDRAQQLAPKTSDDGTETRVVLPSLDSAHADLIVTVPPEAATTVNANHGDIRISQMKSAVTAVANHGNVELAAISGPVTAHVNSAGSSLTARSLGQGISVQGHANEITLADVTGPVSINGEVFGTTHMERVGGAVHYHTSRTDIQLVSLDGTLEIGEPDISIDQAQGPFVITTGNHNVSLDRVAGDIAVTDRNGSVEVIAAPPLGNVTVEDRNGTVRTTVPEGAGFAVQATTANGHIDTNLHFNSGIDQATDEGHNQKALMGMVGSATNAPTVHINTVNGDIAIMKGDVQPLAPAAPPDRITLTPKAASAPARTARARAPRSPAVPTAPSTPPAPASPTP